MAFIQESIKSHHVQTSVGRVGFGIIVCGCKHCVSRTKVIKSETKRKKFELGTELFFCSIVYTVLHGAFSNIQCSCKDL